MRPSRRLLILPAMFALGCEALNYYPEDCRETATCPPPCPGQCVPLPPLEFNGPALLWLGNEQDAPECPPRAPTMVYEGFADLDASNECPACACSSPACVFPSGLTASSAPMCQGPTFTPFDAPLGWNGACTSPGTIPSALLGSVSIDPATVDPCKPVTDNVPTNLDFGSPWGTYAKACAGEATSGVCGNPGLTCLPTAEPPPPGFRQCIMYLRDGDPTCPADYPEKSIFYGGLEDTRECTECECTETAPSTCVAYLSTFQDTACMSPSVATPVGTQTMPLCSGVMSGTTLGSMKATWTTNEPGACAASGGVPVGDAKPLDPRTFCCQPPP